MKKTIVILGFVCLFLVGCDRQPQGPVIINNEPRGQNKTVIIERDRRPVQVMPVVPVVPVVPVAPYPPRPGLHIEINKNCTASHPCGRCNHCRNRGIKIEINR